MNDQRNRGGLKTRVAAIQLDAVVGQLDHNMAEAERLADQAGREGAEWIILPEFFTTGMAFDERLASQALPADGAATALLSAIARRHGAKVGGSFLCHDETGEVHNAFLLVGSDGEVLGRHDKDLPTMWENCFYARGSDAGLIATDDAEVGVAMCWELIRSQTAVRLRGRAELVVGGSCWWSVPAWRPRAVFDRMEQSNRINATEAAQSFAQLVGAPVIHAAHCGTIQCPLPLFPLDYRGFAEGGTAIFGADGEAIAFRAREDGAGIASGEVTIGSQTPVESVPDRYWLCRRGIVPEFAWKYQRAHGRRWYAKHRARQLPSA